MSTTSHERTIGNSRLKLPNITGALTSSVIELSRGRALAAFLLAAGIGHAAASLPVPSFDLRPDRQAVGEANGPNAPGQAGIVGTESSPTPVDTWSPNQVLTIKPEVTNRLNCTGIEVESVLDDKYVRVSAIHTGISPDPADVMLVVDNGGAGQLIPAVKGLENPIVVPNLDREIAAYWVSIHEIPDHLRPDDGATAVDVGVLTEGYRVGFCGKAMPEDFLR